MTKNDVESLSTSWDVSGVRSNFINSIKCQLPKQIVCYTCRDLMFSTVLKVKDMGCLEWFQEDIVDSLIHPDNAKGRIIWKRYFVYMRRHEINLRLITRKQVLNDMWMRFRGHKSLSDDKIDLITDTYKFQSIAKWCQWKSAFDRSVLSFYNNNKGKSIYCSGCGQKCKSINSSKHGKTFHVCAQNECEFLYCDESKFARVKKN